LRWVRKRLSTPHKLGKETKEEFVEKEKKQEGHVHQMGMQGTKRNWYASTKSNIKARKRTRKTHS